MLLEILIKWRILQIKKSNLHDFWQVKGTRKYSYIDSDYNRTNW